MLSMSITAHYPWTVTEISHSAGPCDYSSTQLSPHHAIKSGQQRSEGIQTRRAEVHDVGVETVAE